MTTRLADIEAVYRERFRHFKRVALAIVGDHERAVEAVLAKPRVRIGR